MKFITHRNAGAATGGLGIACKVKYETLAKAAEVIRCLYMGKLKIRGKITC